MTGHFAILGASGSLALTARKGREAHPSLPSRARKIASVVFKPDWSKPAKSATFKRNKTLLQTLPVRTIVFRGSGITENLADKPRTLGIPLSRFDGGGG
jgi:hypothetical protein